MSQRSHCDDFGGLGDHKNPEQYVNKHATHCTSCPIQVVDSQKIITAGRTSFTITLNSFLAGITIHLYKVYPTLLGCFQLVKA